MISITILWDYALPECLSYIEGKSMIKSGNDFKTNVTAFFNYDNNVTVVKRDGSYINSQELLQNNEGEYTDKAIRHAHNIHKMLIAGSFKFKKVKNEY